MPDRELLLKREKLKDQLIQIYKEIDESLIIKEERTSLPPSIKSKQNLSAFLKFRSMITLDLEDELLAQGLSSSRNIHSHVLYSLNAMIHNLSAQQENGLPFIHPFHPEEAAKMKNSRKTKLLGLPRNHHSQPIMVTLDRSMLKSPGIFTDLLNAGMTIARINCAHDDPEIWREFFKRLREGENKNFPCKVYMDLPGPKIRITEIKSEKGYGEKLTIELTDGCMVRIYRSVQCKEEPQDSQMISMGITLPKALTNVKNGDRVYIDDGKISAVVINTEADYIEAKIINVHKNPVKLKTGKGLNFPDSLTYLNVPAITAQDLECLPVICELADIIGLSFAHQPRDIRRLKEHIEWLTSKNIGIVAKIETKEAFHHLGKILMEGLNLDSFGIMIARGDLAVEMGFAQLPSLQNSIMLLCEAAHIPVIWATGVLERMTKKGVPARTEMTDVFHGLNADCIMLNKGPYITDAVHLIGQVDETREILMQERNDSLVFPFVQYGF